MAITIPPRIEQLITPPLERESATLWPGVAIAYPNEFPWAGPSLNTIATTDTEGYSGTRSRSSDT